MWVTQDAPTNNGSQQPTAANSILRFTPSGQQTVFPLSPNGGPIVGPRQIVAGPPSDPDSMWFGDQSNGFHLSRISIDGSSVHNWSVPGCWRWLHVGDVARAGRQWHTQRSRAASTSPTRSAPTSASSASMVPCRRGYDRRRQCHGASICLGRRDAGKQLRCRLTAQSGGFAGTMPSRCCGVTYRTSAATETASSTVNRPSSTLSARTRASSRRASLAFAYAHSTQ
jgi:hypothetical protein